MSDRGCQCSGRQQQRAEKVDECNHDEKAIKRDEYRQRLSGAADVEEDAADVGTVDGLVRL